MAAVWIGEAEKRKGKKEQMIVRKWPGGCSNSKWPPKKRDEAFTPQSAHTHTHTNMVDWHRHARRPCLTGSDAGRHTRCLNA